ncbi:MAG: amidase [Candidatus Marinimicrobia bacterium]|jgi:Asp-tRNA(Asn)/Glu-tRNA(Gln) amidotransferase A subunit family amidase|nr:amidase [Candidatus Neomarinimicrobiota bacterium]MBT3676330.1 amidase [Candidatus Neomarinimicrobiota bacterium]MBT3762898.1 amidase [Candidatus Neomarinimicrobiota bacterium]MBT4068159.1 amidase [Candidatus Neomarinimicrobiota bacterium]MBT4270109.1 amidase [Candidatus Neomarinimicrobiota bacterium]
MKKILFATALIWLGCEKNTVSKSNLASAEKIMGLEFTRSERDSLLDGVNNRISQFEELRSLALPNNVAFPLYYNPLPAGMNPPVGKDKFDFNDTPTERPEIIEACAFMSVPQLAYLIRTKRVTSEELTRMYIDRLKKYGPELECVITITEELAIKQARKADLEIARGKYRGLLHGIPWGAKDLLAVPGYKTTLGAIPFKDQVLDEKATVVEKLEEAGAVLIAKLTLGALAWGDVWFGGKTRNPWNTEQGASGSSAGPGSATAAGLVGFSIGSETWGSIVSPATVNGVTGLRPSFGVVSRAGAMALSWSMDKLGPMTRSVEGAAIIFETIRGTDQKDRTLVDVPFQYPSKKQLKHLRIGYVASAFEDSVASENDKASLKILKSLGLELVPIELPEFPVEALSFILTAEAAAAFDELTRTNKDDEMVRQVKNAWPNVFRDARYIPAVEYINANRARLLLNQKMAKLMETVDVYVIPSFYGDNLLRTNLTGHPCVVVPNGFNEKGTPTSISFIGDLYEDGNVLAVAKAYQEVTDWHKQYPPKFKVNP